MKKILPVFLAFIMVFSAIPLGGLSEYIKDADWSFLAPKASAASYSGTCGDNVSWSLDTVTGELIISGSGAMDDYDWDTTGAPWGYYASSIKSVTVLDGVTNISFAAFRGCSYITSVTIADSVTSIGERAFYDCYSLTSITIPDSVTSIGSYGFYSCNKLKSITIPDGVTIIESSTFEHCTSLTSVTLPDGVTTIGNFAFYDCSSLTSIKIPDGVTDIWTDAFRECISLTSITIPNGVEYLWDDAFRECTGLTSVTISEGVTGIGRSVFLLCTGLTSITIPDSVTSIEDDVFNGCSSNLTIYGKKDSYAQKFANAKGITFVEFVCTAHSFGNWVTDTEPTCTTNGTKHRTCILCGEIKTGTIPKLGHSYSKEWTIDIAPTCTKSGMKTHHCIRCTSRSSSTVIPATGHTYGNWAQEGSERYRVCDKCGITETQEIMWQIMDTEDSRIDYDNCLVFVKKEGLQSIDKVIFVPYQPPMVLGDMVFDQEQIKYTAYPFSGELFGTGSNIYVDLSSIVSVTYKLVVDGDLDGDSICDVIDAAAAERMANGHETATALQAYAANGIAYEEFDVLSYQNVVNLALTSEPEPYVPAPTKEDIFNEYKAAAHSIAENGNCSYSRRDWQEVEEYSAGVLSGGLSTIIGGYLTSYNDSEEKICLNGAESKANFPDCTLTDMSKVISAEKAGNIITIVLADEDTPQNASTSFLGQVSNTVCFLDDVNNEISQTSAIKNGGDLQILNKSYKITAEVFNGKIYSLDVEGVICLNASSIKVSMFSAPVTLTLSTHSEYRFFVY